MWYRCILLLFLSGRGLIAYGHAFGRGEIADTVPAPHADTLTAVKVSVVKSPIEISANKIVVNVSNSILSSGGSALEILNNIPGVTVDQNDNLQIRGRQGVQVSINGKILPVNATDLANLLKGIPAATISRVEVITNPAAAYDAAGNAGIINIVLKKDERPGTNGTVNLSEGQGTYPKRNAGITLNTHYKTLSFFLSYNYTYRLMFNHLQIDRRFYADNTYDGGDVQDNYFKYRYKTHTIRAAADYRVSPKTTLSINGDGFINDYNIPGNSLSTHNDSSYRPIFQAENLSSSGNAWHNYSGTLSLRHLMDSTGNALTADMDYARYHSARSERYINVYRLPDGQPYSPSDSSFDRQRGALDIYSLRTDYNTTAFNGVKLNAGVKSSLVRSDNLLYFFSQVNGLPVTDSTLSHDFSYRENINAIYASSQFHLAGEVVTAGLRAENTGNRIGIPATGSGLSANYFHLFPSLEISHSLGHGQELSITANRRIDRPGYSQLSPLRLYIDATTYKVGNPYLMPQLTNSASLTYRYDNKIISSLTYSVTGQVIRTVFIPDTNLVRVTYQTDKNLRRYRYIGYNTSLNFSPASWWSTVNNILLFYGHYDADILNTALGGWDLACQLNSVNKFTLGKTARAELSVAYNSSFRDAYIYNRPTLNISAGVQRDVFGKKGQLRLNCSDILYTSFLNAVSRFNSLTEDFQSRRESRVISLSLSYSFGKKNEQAAMQKHGGAEEEKERARG